MGDYTPVSSDMGTTTLTTSAIVAGGQLVTVTNGTVAPSTTGDHPIGVAAHDAPSGGRVTVWLLPGLIHEVTVQGVTAVTAGLNSTVIAGTTGTIKQGAGLAADAAAGTLIGIVIVGGTGGTGTGKARFIGV